MRVFSCASVRRRLEAWHDGELPPAEQCAVSQHLEGCPPCAAEARALEGIGAALRGQTARRAPSADDLAGLRAGVLGRATAEDAVSWRSFAADLFQDMHFVLAGLSATAATLVCAALLLGMAHFTTPGRDDSLAGIMDALAAPGSDRNPVTMDARMRPPRVSDDAVPAMLPPATEEDLVFALAAVVTQEGRVSRSQVLLVNRDDREVVLRLMNAVAAARFQPARFGGAPVAVNLVWLVTHTTVRGKSHS
jgi:anti-sigma factor RsiW